VTKGPWGRYRRRANGTPTTARGLAVPPLRERRPRESTGATPGIANHPGPRPEAGLPRRTACTMRRGETKVAEKAENLTPQALSGSGAMSIHLHRDVLLRPKGRQIRPLKRASWEIPKCSCHQGRRSEDTRNDVCTMAVAALTRRNYLAMENQEETLEELENIPRPRKGYASDVVGVNLRSDFRKQLP